MWVFWKFLISPVFECILFPYYPIKLYKHLYAHVYIHIYDSSKSPLYNTSIDVSINTGRNPNCDCRNKQYCLFGKYCTQSKVVYHAKVTSKGKPFLHISTCANYIKRIFRTKIIHLGSVTWHAPSCSVILHGV